MLTPRLAAVDDDGAPLIQLARDDARNATTVADFFGASETAERQLARDELRDACRIGLLAFPP